MRLTLQQYNHLLEVEYVGGPEYDGTTETALLNALSALAEYDILPGAAYAEAPRAAQVLLLCEACNWAAKDLAPTFREERRFYSLKRELATAAVLNEGAFSFTTEDDYGNITLNIYSPYCGTVNVHDPFCELPDEVWANSHLDHTHPFVWSGVYRQQESFRLLQDCELLQFVAFLTRPRTRAIAQQYTDNAYGVEVA